MEDFFVQTVNVPLNGMSSVETEIEGYPTEVTCKRTFRKVRFKVS